MHETNRPPHYQFTPPVFHPLPDFLLPCETLSPTHSSIPQNWEKRISMEDSQLKANNPEGRTQGEEEEEEGTLPPIRDAAVISGKSDAKVSSAIISLAG